MHVFVAGGAGQTGPAIVSELVGSGHTVTGLARSDISAARLEALGATPRSGSMDDLDSLRAGASRADGAVHPLGVGLKMARGARCTPPGRACLVPGTGGSP